MTIKQLTKDEFIELYKNKTLAEIAEILGVSKTSVNNIRKKLNIPNKGHSKKVRILKGDMHTL